MSFSEIDYLLHIQEEFSFLEEDAKNYNYESFCSDKKTILSYTRSLEIIGEACKNITPGFRLKYPQIDWRGFAGLRDIIIHQYFGIDYEIVWKTVTEEVPEALLAINKIIAYLQE
jgi:uncharacterized protein with HEPN domain